MCWLLQVQGQVADDEERLRQVARALHSTPERRCVTPPVHLGCCYCPWHCHPRGRCGTPLVVAAGGRMAAGEPEKVEQQLPEVAWEMLTSTW